MDVSSQAIPTIGHDIDDTISTYAVGISDLILFSDLEPIRLITSRWGTTYPSEVCARYCCRVRVYCVTVDNRLYYNGVLVPTSTIPGQILKIFHRQTLMVLTERGDVYCVNPLIEGWNRQMSNIVSINSVHFLEVFVRRATPLWHEPDYHDQMVVGGPIRPKYAVHGA